MVEEAADTKPWESRFRMCKVVHIRKEPYDVYIGRPSKWGNPFSHKPDTIAEFRVATREEAVRKYEEWLVADPARIAALEELRGKILGCWCKPKACHGDIILKYLSGKKPLF